MTAQKWCLCGAGAIGEDNEADLIQDWALTHQQECDEGLVDEKPVVKPFLLCDCGWKAYGDTRDEAETVLAQHSTQGHEGAS